MSGRTDIVALNNPILVQELRTLRILDNRTNAVCLLREYGVLVVLLGLAIGGSRVRHSCGLAWWWDLPLMTFAVVLIGAVQHRLAGLAHEASHFTLLRNRILNDAVADIFCLFPLFATIQQYRVTHFAHHRYTNDWQKDPDLVDSGLAKRMDRFPMRRQEFLWNYLFRSILPTQMAWYMIKIASQSVLGTGKSPAFGKVGGGVRWLTTAGLAYVGALVIGLRMAFETGSLVLIVGVATAAMMVATAVILVAPATAFHPSTIKHPYSVRTASLMRIGWMTMLFTLFPVTRIWAGIDFAPYFWLLWVVPLLTSFAWFMMLRDVYQHANADDGKLTNSRVFFIDPFTRWAIFVYGQDMHIPHHLFPAIPHYHLARAHRVLKRHSEEYRREVVECHGTFRNNDGSATILDVLEMGTRQTRKTEIDDRRRLAS